MRVEGGKRGGVMVRRLKEEKGWGEKETEGDFSHLTRF